VSDPMISRLVRPALLLVAGMLLGQGALAVAAPAAPQGTTQTRIASCSGFGFQPIDADTGYTWDGRHLYRSNSKGDGWFMCPVDLPHRAVVTKVRFTLSDPSSSVGFEYCGLVRSALGVSGTVQVVGLPVAGIGIGAEPGTVRYPTTSIQNATIDNGSFAYALQCRMVFAPGLQSISSDRLGIIGADVTFRISTANG